MAKLTDALKNEMNFSGGTLELSSQQPPRDIREDQRDYGFMERLRYYISVINTKISPFIRYLPR